MNHTVICGVCHRPLPRAEDQFMSDLDPKKDWTGLGGATTVCKKHVNTHGKEALDIALILGKNVMQTERP